VRIEKIARTTKETMTTFLRPTRSPSAATDPGAEHQADDGGGQDVGDLAGIEVELLADRLGGQAHGDDVRAFQQGGQEA
jgi:hypothetical protein